MSTLSCTTRAVSHFRQSRIWTRIAATLVTAAIMRDYHYRVAFQVWLLSPAHQNRWRRARYRQSFSYASPRWHEARHHPWRYLPRATWFDPCVRYRSIKLCDRAEGPRRTDVASSWPPHETRYRKSRAELACGRTNRLGQDSRVQPTLCKV